MDAIENAVPRATAKRLRHYLKGKQDRIAGGLRLQGRYDSSQKIWAYCSVSAG
jgi:hypothetical protein